MKKRIFDNNLKLNRFVLMRRFLDTDPNIEIRLYDVPDPLNITIDKHYYIEVESILTDAQITAALVIPQSQAETNAYNLFVGARAGMKAIPQWATWTSAEWATYYNANISTTQINAINNLAGAKAMLDKMSTVINGLAKMEIELRNKVF